MQLLLIAVVNSGIIIGFFITFGCHLWGSGTLLVLEDDTIASLEE